MDNLNDRKKAFEKKFAHDAEMVFKAEARRNRMLAEWVGEKFGMSDDEVEKYGVTLIGADLKEAGDDDVLDKVMADADERGVKLDRDAVGEKSDELLTLAKAQLMEDED